MGAMKQKAIEIADNITMMIESQNYHKTGVEMDREDSWEIYEDVFETLFDSWDEAPFTANIMKVGYDHSDDDDLEMFVKKLDKQELERILEAVEKQLTENEDTEENR